MRSSAPKAYPGAALFHAGIFSSLLIGFLSCSGLRLDKDGNCLNERAGCFKADKTAPLFKESQYPIENTQVSQIPYVDLRFSEELNNPKISDFVISGPGKAGLYIYSVEKKDNFTYRLTMGSTAVADNQIYIDFENLKDYNGNPVTNKTRVTYIGNTQVGIRLTSQPTNFAISSLAGGYNQTNISFAFTHDFVEDDNNTWRACITTGVIDCPAVSAFDNGTGLASADKASAPGTPVALVRTPGQFTAGFNRLVIYMENLSKNKTGTNSWPIFSDNTAPTTTNTPPTDPSATPLNVVLTCTDNADKILYTAASQQSSAPTPPSDPDFDGTGNPTVGTLYTGPILTPSTPDPLFTTYKWRCIDKGGNKESVKTATYVIDSSVPTVTTAFDSTFYDFISPSGFSGTTVKFSTNQANPAQYKIVYNATSCAAGDGTNLVNMTTLPASPGTQIQHTFDTTTHFTGDGVFNVRICVRNVSLVWGSAFFQITRDSVRPATTASPTGGSFGALQSVVLTCSDNASKIAYTKDGSTPSFYPNGQINTGLSHTNPIDLTDGVTTINYLCRDKANNEELTVKSQVYTIDTVLPTVAIVSNSYSALAATGTQTSTTLSWTSTKVNANYSIRLGGADCTTGTVLQTGTTPGSINTPTNTVLNQASFTPDGNYQVRICVANAVGNFGSVTQSITKDSIAPAIAPINLQPSISAVDATTFTLTWNAATDTGGSGVATYQIFRSVTSGFYGATADYTATSSPATIVMPDTQKYYLRIVPVDAAGNASATPYNELSTKPSITLVVAGLDTANSKTFNLTDGASSATISANGTSAWTTSLATNATYRFRVSVQPTNQVCGIRQKQFGSFVSDLTINVDCTDGFIVSGTFQKKPAAPLDYRLYRGKTSTVASNATSGFGTLTPGGLAFSGNGSLYVSEVSTNRIMRVNQGTGAVTNSSGDGTAGTVDGTSANARFNNPSFMVSDGSNLYVSQVGTGLGSDTQDAIRKVDGIGTVTTLVTSTNANDPEGIVISGDLLYWANRATHQIKSFNITTGAIAIVAGTGGVGTNDGAAASATFNQPFGLAIISNKIYVTDFGSHRIRVIDLGTSTVSTLSGSSVGFQDGPAGSARFNAPGGIVTDGRDLYVADYSGARLRKIKLDRTGGTNHIVSTLAGDGTQATGSTGTGANTRFMGLVVLATDGRSIFGSDEGDSKIRKITDDGVVGYWPLDGTPIDHSSDGAGSFDLTLSTATTNVTGRYGGSDLAYRFSGFSLSTPDQNQFDVSANYSISAWIYPNATGGMRIVDKITAGSCDGFLLDTLATSNKLRFSYCFGANHLISGAAAPVNEWTHVTVTFSSAERRARIYFNGRLDAEADTGAGTTPVNALPLRIGIDSTGSNIFSGAMAGVRLYNRALTDAEVADLAQDANSTVTGSPFNNDPTGLLAHYTFNGGSPALPSGPVGNNLGAVGTPQIGVHGDSSGSSFVGTIDVNASASGLPISNSPRTLCLWYNPQSVQSNRVLLMHGANAANQGFGITLASASQLQFFNWGGPNVFFNYTSQLRSWQHVCGTLSGTTVEMFVNGISIGTNTGTIGTINTPLSGSINIGSAVDGNPPLRFNGYIDDVRIYNSVLSTTQIRRLAAAVPAGLVARLDYDGDTTDSSGYGNSVINNGATVTDDRYGTNSRAYKFNGTSEEMRLNAAGRMASDATFALWINPSTTPGSLAGLFDNWNGDGSTGGATGGGIVFNGPTGLLVLARGGGAINDCYMNWMPPTGAYRHIAATIRSGAPGNISVYIDGSLVGTCAPANLQPSFNNSVNFSIGRNIWGSGLNGNIDDVRLYNRALSAAEVRALVQQPNKKIYLTAVSYGGNLGGVSGADTKCNFAGDGNKPGGGPWKAMLVNTNTSVVRRACTTANCITSGVAESVDWVLRPNITYMLSNNAAPIMTANWNGVFDFVTGANNDNSTGLTTFTNAINGTPGATAWTGMTSEWYPDIAQCGDWNNNVVLLGGPWPNKGVYGQSDLTNQPNGATPGVVYAGWGDNLCGSMMNRLYCVEQ